jgi:hypothetical protein
MKKLFLTAFMFAFMAVSTAVMMPSKSEAIPAFARQVGMECSACHFMHFPKLNSFGRAFKLGGFTDVGAQELIEGDHLSLPATLNAAFVTKVRYQKSTPVTNGNPNTGTDRGAIQFPDEAALWLAGRMSEHWGAAIEKPNDAVSLKFVFSMPVSFGKAGLSIYTTDALGPAFGMELFNTSVQRSVRGFEDRKAVYAAHSTGVASGIATGLTAFAGGDMFFAAVGLFGPANGNNIDVGTALSVNYRLAFTPQLGGFDAMIGIFGQAGSTKAALGGATITTYNTRAFGVDLQLQGEIAGMATEIQAMYVASGQSNPGTATALYADADAWSINGELAVLPVAGLQLAYLDHNVAGGNTADYRATTLGAYYELAQNVELMINYSMKTGLGRSDKNMFTLLFETAF